MRDTFISTITETAPQTKPGTWASRRYLVVLVTGVLSALLLFLLAASSLPPYDNGATPDYFAQIARDGTSSWYRNFGGRNIPQIQDQDVFYSNVGSSVAAAVRMHES